MPQPKHNIWLSDQAMTGLRQIGATRGLPSTKGLSRALREISEADAYVHDDRPEHIKNSDDPLKPKIWNADDTRRPRHLGELPIEWLLHLAEHYEIHPFLIQRATTRGLNTKRGKPWFVPDRLARFSTESRISAVLEAIGIGYLKVGTITPIAYEQFAKRSKRIASQSMRRVWVGGLPATGATDDDD